MMSRRGNISAEQLEEEEFSRAGPPLPPLPPQNNVTTKNSSSSTAAAASSSNNSKSRKRSSSKGNSKNRKYPPGNDKLHSSHPSNGTYDKLTHEKPPLPSATTNPKQPPTSNVQKIKALNGSNQPDPMVDVTDLLALCQSCTDEDTQEIKDEIKDKSDNLPDDTWDKSHGNFIECDTCNSAPATTRPVVPVTDPKKGKPGACPNTTCATCADKSLLQFMTRPCCMADGNEVRKGGKTCADCQENRVCENFDTCGKTKRFRHNDNVYTRCKECYMKWIAEGKCKVCKKTGLAVGHAKCADCVRDKQKVYEDKKKGREGERCQRCHNLFVEGDQRYYIQGGNSSGLKVCSRNRCNKKCKMALRMDEDGKNVYCDDDIKDIEEGNKKKNSTCGGYSRKTVYDANGNKTRQRVDICLNKSD